MYNASAYVYDRSLIAKLHCKKQSGPEKGKRRPEKGKRRLEKDKRRAEKAKRRPEKGKLLGHVY